MTTASSRSEINPGRCVRQPLFGKALRYHGAVWQWQDVAAQYSSRPGTNRAQGRRTARPSLGQWKGCQKLFSVAWRQRWLRDGQGVGICNAGRQSFCVIHRQRNFTLRCQAAPPKVSPRLRHTSPTMQPGTACSAVRLKRVRVVVQAKCRT